MEIRKHLCWQQLFGGGLNIGWADVMSLTMDEVSDLCEYVSERRRKEWKAAFGK